MGLYEETGKRKFKFYMTDEFDNEYNLEQVIDDYDSDYETELQYLLDRFKDFLRACGWLETTVSHLQYLEDDEWKYVLEQYHEWDTEKERLYSARKESEQRRNEIE